ncbi:uncharacterized protein LOC134542451 [Bacillus rossius redtenbacheri]|uniref:uncharacterized protein LOC134542451 n=1 Tax=Bacillus rossius redtenbacheri TaxID=93214 RepID=UPI002FDDA65E
MYDEEDEILLVSSAVVVIAAYHCMQRKHKRRSRRWWCSNLFKDRVSNQMLGVLKAQEISGQYKNFTRMSPTTFEDLLIKIGPKICKKETHLREPITIQDRLAVTLRFLATGDSYSSLQYLFRISKQAIGGIVTEVCSALIEVLKENIKLPKNPAEWMEVVKVFEDLWNLPHCVGAIDGKHVIIQSPMNSGSEFYNYKSQFSIVLFALVDGNYNFLFADVGCQGRISDGGVFNNSKLYDMMTKRTLGLPSPTELPGRQMKVPYFFAADNAFALGENILKPYSGDLEKGSCKRIFNYRLSRARRVVENAFGIASSVFRVLRKPILLEPEKVQLIVTAIIHLHNHLRWHSTNLYTPQELMDYEEGGVLTEGSWRKDENMTSLVPLRSIPRRSSAHFQKIRDELADYCVKEGAISWQKSYA